MRELRLKATDERLVWWHCTDDGGQYLSRESKVGDTAGWFASVTPIRYGCYDIDLWLGGNYLDGGNTRDPLDEQAAMERVLVEAGVAYFHD